MFSEKQEFSLSEQWIQLLCFWKKSNAIQLLLVYKIEALGQKLNR